MKQCAQCKTQYYCGPECQRADWKRHKVWCKREVNRAKIEQAFIDNNEIGAHVADDFDAWFSAMAPQLYIWTCVHGLEVYKDRSNIQTKFVHLAVRERRQRPSSALRMFEYESITVYDRVALPMLLGGDAREAKLVVDQYSELDLQAKARGKAGTALVVTSVSPSPGSTTRAALFRTTPVTLLMEDVTESEDTPEWKDLIKDIINNGTSIRRMMAEREKRGVF
ncbi:hypothetical protein B0H15DRAFT_1022431 [Mycena belliarum]|uniref:MYND-type domain-containing protein n=1 Tax=Mycena belliarum TaxID=1033014 RepID=A0AAD6XQW1_9AGAR|nr:hypothetical protein B0H15DRAFT_1022431 [Mycena belliae]